MPALEIAPKFKLGPLRRDKPLKASPCTAVPSLAWKV